MSVCLLNYRVDGSTFWNQFFIAALRDAAGNVTNFVGVQCKVSDQYAATVIKQQVSTCIDAHFWDVMFLLHFLAHHSSNSQEEEEATAGTDGE